MKPDPDNPSELLGNAILSNGGYRHNRNWVFWTFLIEVGYLAFLIVATAIALKILNREPSYLDLVEAYTDWEHAAVPVSVTGFYLTYFC